MRVLLRGVKREDVEHGQVIRAPGWITPKGVHAERLVLTPRNVDGTSRTARSEVVPTLHGRPDLGALKKDLRSLLDQDRDEEVIELVGKLAADKRRLLDWVASFMCGRAHGGSERISSDQVMMFMMRAGTPTQASAEGQPA